ncbi:rhomboid family protein [Streptococcus pyogenes]|nr:rhomboid family protein [Streptococcus pyogenes]
MGNAFTFWLTPETVAAGASTSLFGLFAAIVVLSFLGKNQALKDLGKSYQTLIVVNFTDESFYAKREYGKAILAVSWVVRY